MITLPWPPASLSSNARGHWATKSRATKKYRAEAALCTMAAKPIVPAEGEIALTIRFVPPHNRGDVVNYPALLKAGLDGVADALKVNDKRFAPQYLYAPAEKPGRVEITVTP
jgi:Holliday junction resolvase RusA-like endonuclease